MDLKTDFMDVKKKHFLIRVHTTILAWFDCLIKSLSLALFIQVIVCMNCISFLYKLWYFIYYIPNYDTYVRQYLIINPSINNVYSKPMRIKIRPSFGKNKVRFTLQPCWAKQQHCQGSSIFIITLTQRHFLSVRLFLAHAALAVHALYVFCILMQMFEFMFGCLKFKLSNPCVDIWVVDNDSIMRDRNVTRHMTKMIWCI